MKGACAGDTVPMREVPGRRLSESALPDRTRQTHNRMEAPPLFAELAAAFSSPEAIVQLLMLVFLEIILGIDNIVFISITSDRLPIKQQHIGRRLGLAAAMVTRICLLFTLGWIMHLTKPLFSIGPVEVTGKNIILLCGGIYLIYKGITEIREMLALTEERERHGHPDHKPKPPLTLPRAVVTIAIMDIVFSLDSVITAVGMVDHVIIAAIAIVVAILFMMVFADVVSDFINKNPQIKLLALFFILTIGVLLVIEFFGIEEVNGMGVNWFVYAAMFFSLIVTLIQMRYQHNLDAMHAEIAEHKEALASGDAEAHAKEAERQAAVAESERLRNQ